MDYPEYLKSEHWQQTRKAALEFWGRRCSICKSGFKVEVHHNNYQCLGREKLSDTTCLCELCHELFSSRSRLRTHEPVPIQNVLQQLQADYAAKHGIV